MRISDWSSDVCSSDLCSQRLDATDPAQNELRSAPADYHRGCTWINAAKPVRRSQGAWFKTVTHNTIRRTVTIGRASCRARVCQEVYISVVAGSLKNKQRKDIKKENIYR